MIHRISHTSLLLLLGAGLLAGCASTPASRSATRSALLTATSPTPTAAASAAVRVATQQVIATERAFAQTMAHRDFKAFLALLSPDAIFFNGNQVEHGPAQIAVQWAPYFDQRIAPFSWAPDHVEVLPDGKLALSTGPLIQQGTIVGRFNSVWRLEAPNSWHIVFDKGESICTSPRPAEVPDAGRLFGLPQ